MSADTEQREMPGASNSRGKRSIVWKYFKFQTISGKESKSKTVCEICGKVLNYCSNTTNMMAHLDNLHWGIVHDVTAKKAKLPTEANQTSKAPGKTGFSGKQFFNLRKGPLNRNNPRSIAIDKGIAEYISVDMEPLSVVEGVGFCNLIKILEPYYDPPSRSYVHDKYLLPMYHATVETVRNKLANAEMYALTSDGWTSLAEQSYISLTCHFINKEFMLESILLNTKYMPQSHTGENLLLEIENLIKFWNLNLSSNLKPFFVADNAKNIIKAVELGEFPSIGCFAHILNLAVNKALELNEISALLGKLRKLVGHFKHSTLESEALKRAEIECNLAQLKLIKDILTRWNAALDMIRRIIKILPAIVSVLYGNEKYKHLLPKDNELQLMKNLVALLEPFETATIMISSEKKPTASLILPIINIIDNNLNENANDSTLIKKAKKAIKCNLDTRYQENEKQKLLKICTILDPRFKDLSWLSYLEREEIHILVKNETINLVEIKGKENCDQKDLEDKNPDISTENIEKITEQDEKKKKFKAFFQPILKKKTGSIGSKIDIIVTEFENYLKEPEIDADFDPLKWWKSREMHYPNLSITVKNYMCIPATSVSSERVFSTAGNLINSKRQRLTPDNVDMLMFLNKNYEIAK